MTPKELKRLTRTELLQMLLHQVEENESLRSQVQMLQEELDRRALIMQQSGSMAEAALKLNGVFDQAQQAAEDYLQNIRLANAEPEEYTRKIREEAQIQADAIIADAQRRSDRILTDAEEYWLHMRQQVQALLEDE